MTMSKIHIFTKKHTTDKKEKKIVMCLLKLKKHLCEQAHKAMYRVIRKIRQFNLPVDCQFDLFDNIVVPVLLYGCEILGYENIEVNVYISNS